MSIWGIVWSYIKGAFSLNSSAKEKLIDYALGKVNEVLQKPDLSARIEEAHAVAENALLILKKYEDWCPLKWKAEFDETVAAIDALIDTFEDGKVEAYEVVTVCNQFKVAYDKWMED